MVSALSCLQITWESCSALQDSLILVWAMCLLKVDINLHCVILHDTNLPQSQQVCPWGLSLSLSCLMGNSK